MACFFWSAASGDVRVFFPERSTVPGSFPVCFPSRTIWTPLTKTCRIEAARAMDMRASEALLITGTGIGIAWPHLSAWAMSCVDDPTEGPAAAAAINTVQLICGAFGAGLAGVVVNLSAGGGAAPARWLFGMFAVLAAFVVITSTKSGRQTCRSTP